MGDIMKLANKRVDELTEELKQYIDPIYYELAREVVEKWFKRNFEIYGQSHKISNRLVREDDQGKYKAYVKKSMAKSMALAIFEKCGISKEVRKEESLDPYTPHFYESEYPPGYEEITVEMLVMLREPKKSN